ncbi:MAG: YkgJ family cysteine cluster protein [Promethearchaeota archaeon]
MSEEQEKKKFAFNCTQCGKCCSERGPIPLTMDDLVMWAQNKVVANMVPYIKFIRTPQGSVDLVLARQDADPYAFLKDLEKDENKEEKKDEKEEPKDLSCPFYNKETKKCLVYENRPLSCRTYPLEFDGKNYLVVDPDCPGVGNGENTKEQRKALRDLAKEMNTKLSEMRIAMPVLTQAMQPFVLQEIMNAQKQYMQAMEKMDPEQRKKVEEQMKSQMGK